MSTPVVGTMARLMTETDGRRKEILKEIEKITNTRIGVYISNSNVSPNFIDHNDPIFFNDVLESIAPTKKLDVIIDSPGGDANIAERLAFMCRDCCTEFRAIIINSAKSAATMWALAADEILMGFLSEIGPIDPQIRMVSPGGNTTFVPAASIINSIAQLNSMLQQSVDQRIVMGLIQKIEPPILDVASNAIAFSKDFAFRWLSDYMLKHDKDKAQEIADALSDNSRWLSHGKRIGVVEARKLGLNVTRIRKDTILWKLLWEYYCRVKISMNANATAKLFETSAMTINFAATVRRQLTPQPERSSPESVDEK